MDAPAGLIRLADRLHAHAGLVMPFSFEELKEQLRQTVIRLSFILLL
jgi:hypothetical protein